VGKKVVGPEKKVMGPEKKVVGPKQNVSAYLPFPFWNACFSFSDAFSNVRRAHHEDLKAVDIDRSVYKNINQVWMEQFNFTPHIAFNYLDVIIL
jgi:hypothetical protein